MIIGRHGPLAVYRIEEKCVINKNCRFRNLLFLDALSDVSVSFNWHWMKNGIRYVKFDTFTPAAERGLPVTRVISRMTLQQILARAVGEDVILNDSNVVSFQDDGNKVIWTADLLKIVLLEKSSLNESSSWFSFFAQPNIHFTFWSVTSKHLVCFWILTFIYFLF